jgi:ABC-2 type transport system permease protein
MGHPALVILGKDARLRLRDRSVVLFAVVVPLGLSFVLSLVFPEQQALTLTAAVVDEDGGPVADGFVTGVVPALTDDGVLVPVDVPDRAAGRQALLDGTVDAVWLLPPGFSEAVQAGDGGTIEVLVNPDRALSAEIARGVAEAYATQVDAVALSVATAVVAGGGQPDAALVDEVAAAAGGAEPVVDLGSLVAEDRQLDGISYLAAGMAAFFVFFTVQFGVTGLLEERAQGTMPRLLAAPIHPAAIQVGKALGAFLLGLVSMAVLAVGSALLLGASWGPTIGVAVLIVALVTAATGVMAFVGSFARTAEQAGNLQSIVAVTLGMLGGVFFPVGGGLMGLLSAVSPHAWFLRGLGDQVASGQWTSVLPAAAAIAAFGLVAAVPAVLRLRQAVAW